MNKKQSTGRPSEKLLAARDRQAAALPEPVRSLLTLHKVASVITLAGYDSDLLKEACRVKMEQIKTDLGYDSAPEFERLLIDQIALCWLRVGEAEAMYSQIMSATHKSDKAEYAEKRLTACMSRYTRSLESLARMRRDVIPAIQMNIAGQQIVKGV
jgi:hypothetical protein